MGTEFQASPPPNCAVYPEVSPKADCISLLRIIMIKTPSLVSLAIELQTLYGLYSELYLFFEGQFNTVKVLYSIIWKNILRHIDIYFP